MPSLFPMRSLCGLLSSLLFFTAVSEAQILNSRPLSADSRPQLDIIKSSGRTTALPWPATFPPPRVTTITERDDDRGLLTFTRLQFPAVILKLNQSRLDDWHPVAKPRRYAIEWSNYWVPELILGIAQCPAHQFTPPLATTDWQAYVQSLRRHHGSRFRLLTNDDSVTTPDMARPLLGGFTRVLVYEILPTKDEEPTERVIQIFCVTDQATMVIGCEGPSAAQQRIEETLSYMISRIEAEKSGN